jgi:formate-dependent nitrite reductase cytochrome c552 subunit
MTDKELSNFYHSRVWKRKRLEVLTEQHYECQQCKKAGKLTLLCHDGEKPKRHSKVKYSRANVHHVNEVKIRPELRLSKYYVDTDGRTKCNLEAICDDCHNEEHKRFSKGTQKPQLKEEKW